MKISTENFDETSLKVTHQEPNVTLHLIRTTVKRLTEAGRVRAEGEKPAAESVEAVTEELASQLKKLVESPYFDLNPVVMQQTKDIFNGILWRLEDWRNILQADKGRREILPGQESAIEHLVYLLRGGSLLSWQQPPTIEFAENTNILNDMIKETDDIRVLTFAFRIKNNIGGPTQRVTDNFEKASYVAMAQNLLRSPSDHYTLQEMAKGKSKNGEDILAGDFIFEIERPISPLNDRPTQEKITVPRDRILTQDKIPSQIVQELIEKYGIQVSDSNKLKAKLEAKVTWFRSCAIPDVAKNPLKYLFKLIQTVYQQKQYAPQEFNELLKDSFFVQSRDYLSEETDQESVVQVLHSMCVLYKGRGETTGFDPFLDIPRGPSDSNEDQQSWLLRGLQDIASAKLDPETGLKVFKLQILKENFVKSSYFQWCFLRMFRNILFYVSNRQQVLALETTQMITQLFKILHIEPLAAQGEEVKETETQVQTYNTRVVNEALILLRNLAKPRHEEQVDIITNYESRLIYEMTNLKKKTLSAADGEDFYQEQDLMDKLDLCKAILTHLHELSIRDQTGSITRKIQESKILNLFLSFKGEDNLLILDTLVPSFFLLIGQICNNSPGVTPQLIRNGIIPALFEMAHDRLPETDNSFHTFLFCMSQVIIHDEGKQAAATSSVFQSVIRQVVEKVKFYELSPNQTHSFHAKQYLKSIVERDAIYKDILKAMLDEVVDKGTEYARSLRTKYFQIASQATRPIKDRKDEIQNTLKKRDEFKLLSLIQRLILNFAGGNNSDYEGRNVDVRWTQSIITSDFFSKLLELFDIVGQNPALSDMSLKFAKSSKPLLEAQNFSSNIDQFIDQWHLKLKKVEGCLGGKPFSKLETLPLEFTQEDEKMDGSDSGETFIGALHSFLVHCYTFYTMHSASIVSIGQKDKVKTLIASIVDLTLLIAKSKCATKVKEIQEFISQPKLSESEEYDRKELMMSRNDYLDLPGEDIAREIFGKNMLKRFEYSTSQYFLERIPMMSDQLLSLRELLMKYQSVQFQNQRPGRDANQNREIQEKSQKFVGQQALKIVKSLMRQTLKIGDIENTPKSCYHLMMMVNILDNMNAFATKAWFSSISYFEFYVNGGLKCLLDVYNWVREQVQQVRSDKILASHWSHLDQIAQRISSFILRYIIEEDKSVRDIRISEVYLQTLFQLKMDPHFDNAKQFIQNICYTLCNELLTQRDKNPLLQLEDKPGVSYLIEVPMALLSSASKQFQNCPTLKIGFGNHRNYDVRADDHRGGRGAPRGGLMPPNPLHVQQILDLGFGYPRDQIIQALQQNRDDVNRAIDFLLTQQPRISDANDPFAQILNAIDQAAGASGNRALEGDDEDMDIDADFQQAIEESAFLEEEKPIVQVKPKLKLEKPQKVTESEVQDLVKKILHQGFEWLTEAFDSIPDATRSQTVLLEIMKNWKTDLSGHEQVKEMKQMYAKVDEILKAKLLAKVSAETDKMMLKQDAEMLEEAKQKEKNSQTCAIIQKASQFMRLIQRLIISQKGYMKEAIQTDLPLLCHRHINNLTELSKKAEPLKDQNSGVAKCIQNLIHSFLFTLFTLVHIQQSQVSGMLMDLTKKNQMSSEMVSRIKTKYTQRLPPHMVMILCNNLIDNSLAGHLKPQIMVTAFSLAFRVILDKNAVTVDYRQNFIQTIFTKLNEALASQEKAKALDHNLINSISILFFETDSVLQAQLEKFIQRVLYTKYEYETEVVKKQPPKDAPTHAATKTSFYHFLGFFKRLSNKNQDIFKKLLGDTCEVNTTKANGKFNIGSAQIMLKEAIFAEVKKTIGKERAVFKQAQKLVDYQSDKTIKTQIQAAKKTLLNQVPVEIKGNFQSFLESLSSSSSQFVEEFDSFLTSQASSTALTIPKLKGGDLQPKNQTQVLEMLSKLCQAYPAYTVIMMPSSSGQQQQQVPKKTTFIQWYIKEFLLTQMLQRTTKAAPALENGEELKQDPEELVEVTYQMNSPETLKLVEDHVCRFLNRLTSFNHLMTLNEQLVKHQLRSKFLIEALTLLQKRIKEKNSAKSSLKQKALIQGAMYVIEALINPTNLAIKSLNLPQDNFLNSLRLCIVRDASASSDLPQSLIRTLDDVLTDYMDVSLPQSADLVTRSVTLLRIISEFLATEKKREEEAKLATDLEEHKHMEVIGDQLMRAASVEDQPAQDDEDDEEVSAGEGDSDDEDNQEVVHQVQIVDDEDDEDEEQDEDEEGDEDIEEQDDGEQIAVDEIEDEYDEEADEDEVDELNGGIFIREQRRGAAGAGNDIINMHVNQPDRHMPYRNFYGNNRGAAERFGQGGLVDWSQEEAEVQRILGNFRSNRPDVAPVQAPERDHHGLFDAFRGPGGQRPRQNLQDDSLKKGLIDQTFEDLRIMSDQEVYLQVVSQQNSLDREVQQANIGAGPNLVNQVPRQQAGQVPAILERQAAYLFGRPIVDELDEEDFPGARLWPPRDLGLGNMEEGGRIFDLLQQEHDILNRLLMNEGLPPQRIGAANWGAPPGYRRPAGGAGVEGDAQFENGQFLQQIRSQMDQLSVFQTSTNQVEQFGQSILQSVQVNVEEEIKDEKKPAAASQQQQVDPSAQSQIDHIFRGVFNQPLSDPLNMPLPQGTDQQLLSDFFAPLIINPRAGEQNLQRSTSPMLIQNNPLLPHEALQEPINAPLSVSVQQRPESESVIQIQPNQQVNVVAAQDEEIKEPSSENQVPQEGGVVQLIEQLAVLSQQQQPEIQDASMVSQQEVQPEELRNEEVRQEEEVKQPVLAQEPPPVDPPGTTFGYDNDLLMTYGIDPAILAELPEELRAELLSSIDIPEIQQQQNQQQQPPAQQQPAAQQQPGQAQEEEKKQDQAQEPQPAAQAQPAAAQQEPAYYALARDLGYDPEFLANLPEEMRNELIQQAQQERAPPRRQAEQMDVASFLATVTDQTLRREIFMNMDEATVATLPPLLMAEARRVQEYIRNDRQRMRDQFHDRARNIMGGADEEDMGLGVGMFGRRRREEIERLARQQQQQQNQEKTIEEVVNLRLRQISAEAPKDDITSSISNQLVQDEKIIEAMLTILIANDKIQCDLIPCLQFLLKIQNSNGVPVIRNKLVNAITFLMKNLALGNDLVLTDLGIKATEVKKKQCILIMIGTLRLLLKSNKGLMKYILKGLISRDDGQSKGPGTQMLRKQLKAIGYKQPVPEELVGQGSSSLIEGDMIDTTSAKKSSKERPFVAPSPLAEIFGLIKVDLFKQEKMLMKNLTLLIHQILKNFDIARQELEQSQQQISQETISTIAEVLSLENIDQHMMEDLGDFLFKISRQKRSNFALISEYCQKKSSTLVDRLSGKLTEFMFAFEDIKGRISPSKKLGLNSREMSQLSNQEEEKGDGMINTSSFALSLALARSQNSLQPTQSKGQQIKLEDDEEKQLRQLLKVYDDSEVLYRIFKLFNLFYDKFSQDKEANKDEMQLDVVQTAQSRPEDVIQFVRSTYESDDLKLFVSSVSDVLKVIFKTGIEPNEGVSNLIFCVLSSFYPELFDSIKVEEEQKAKEKKELEEQKGEKTKYLVKMIPVQQTGPGHISKEKFTLFRNPYYITNRIEELSSFCMINKRIINKMIKSKPNLFVNELEGLIRHMPNLLDFDNKRIYFKKELTKFKKASIFGDTIQLNIRRQDIFQDSFAQIRDRTANEMKGRLHITYSGERGQDAGGLTRDFFIELSREMFNPNYSLFVLSSSGSTYYPNPKSHVEVQHLSYFKFIGRMVGKAIFDECLLECYFVKSLYKIMTGEALCFSDLEDFDNEFYNNMKWCLENDVECLMTTFVAETDYFGKPLEVELIENGKNITVSNQNKREYVEKLCFFKLYSEIQRQVDNFLEGFHELIPKDLVSIFNFKELELLISGLPNFDLNDLKNNTEFSGYNSTSQQVLWLWEVLESFDSSERAEFLQFVTGSSKVPLDGFKGLIGMRGPQKFTVAKIKSEDFMRLPTGHTCFNQIDLPEYPSKEILHERLLLAIKETKGFGFA